MTTPNSRRRFIKDSTSLLAASIAIPALAGCGNNSVPVCQTVTNSFLGDTSMLNGGVAGLLYSQIGYEPGHPIRLVVRMSEKLAGDKLSGVFSSVDGKASFRSAFNYWGKIWKSHWWVCEVTEPKLSGVYNMEVYAGKELLFTGKGLTIQQNILWDSSIELAAADMLERRSKFTRVGAGWMDAGVLWVESPAQSGMVMALEEIVELKSDKVPSDLLKRIYHQITVGCDYLVMLRAEAEKRGHPKGAMSHDLHGHEDDIVPSDAVKAVVALARAVRLLPDTYSEKKAAYKDTALLTMNWLTNKATPMGDYGFSRFQRGMPEDTPIPKNEWQTRYLVMYCQACIDLFKLGELKYRDMAVTTVEEIMQRQISQENGESGFYGHFYEFPSLNFSEKSWAHGIVKNQFGADIGEFFPNYLMPVIEMCRIWSDHPDAPLWEKMLRDFTYGYLIPACERNPFKIVPLGIFGDEGPIWFCGTFHGTNTIYGYTAAHALELANYLKEPKLIDIAYGNIQWLAGLNSGVTKEAIKESVIYTSNIPPHLALPASMMFGVGNRWAGTWFGTRGVICNGFSTGKQFEYDVAPIRENDGPFSFTDEDWIPHSAGWLTALVRL